MQAHRAQRSATEYRTIRVNARRRSRPGGFLEPSQSDKALGISSTRDVESPRTDLVSLTHADQVLKTGVSRRVVGPYQSEEVQCHGQHVGMSLSAWSVPTGTARMNFAPLRA